MDTSRPVARAALVALLACLALVGGMLPAGAVDAPSPAAPTQVPADQDTTDQDTATDETPTQTPTEEPTGTSPAPMAPEPSSGSESPDPTAESPTEPLPDEQVSDPVATTVGLTASAGTTMPQEPLRGTVVVTADGASPDGAVVRVTADGPSMRTVDVVVGAGGTASWSLTDVPAGTYRLTAAVQADEQRGASTSPAVTVVVQAGRWVSLLVNSGFGTRVLTRENFWLRGRVLTTAGRPQAGVAVSLYRYSGSGRTRVATVRTNAQGWYTWAPADRRAGTYRAQVSATRYSAKQAVKVGTGERTLASREASLSFLLGSRVTGVRSGGGRTWRYFTKGVLIQSGSRTWVVRQPMTAELSRRDGAGGSLGAPTGDVRCGLPEGGCLQQFRTGAIYVNAKAKDTLTSAVSPTLGAADLLAVARSQVGYREPKPRKSKYNRWIGRTGPYDPWCGFFVSWLAHAGGKPGSVIKATSFKKLLDAERKRGRTSRTPKVGRLAYIGYFSRGTASHVGIVTQVSSTHVWTIEGNVSAGGGMKHPRGVHVVKRPKSRIVFYADPRY
jgi:hypothetical protein